MFHLLMSSPMTSNNVNALSTTETESTHVKTEKAPNRKITSDVYTNIAYSIKDPTLAPYYHKLQKITSGC